MTTATERKPRRRLTLADRLTAVDAKIHRARLVVQRLEVQRSVLIEGAKEAARAQLAAVEAVK